MGISICQECGEEFEKIGGTQKYCSIKCRQKYGNRRARENKAKIKLSKEPVKKICKWCGIEFEQAPRSKRIQKFCSKKCSAESHKQKLKNERNAVNKNSIVKEDGSINPWYLSRWGNKKEGEVNDIIRRGNSVLGE